LELRDVIRPLRKFSAECGSKLRGQHARVDAGAWSTGPRSLSQSVGGKQASLSLARSLRGRSCGDGARGPAGPLGSAAAAISKNGATAAMRPAPPPAPPPAASAAWAGCRLCR